MVTVPAFVRLAFLRQHLSCGWLRMWGVLVEELLGITASMEYELLSSAL